MTFERGTFVYMSPEQYFDGKYEFPADIWYILESNLISFYIQPAYFDVLTIIRSLGCVMYELLFLELAFKKGQMGRPPIPKLDGFLLSKILKK